MEWTVGESNRELKGQKVGVGLPVVQSMSEHPPLGASLKAH